LVGVIIVVAAIALGAVGLYASDKKDDTPIPNSLQIQEGMDEKPDEPLEPSQITSKDDFMPRPKGYDILIDKSAREMKIFVSGKLYRTYTVYLGFTPDGHKTRRGDGRTPEGEYYISRRNEASVYYRSLLISYPSPRDTQRAVSSGLVNRSVLDAVISAYAKKATPPQNTRLGGNICIHGEGSRSRPQKDWTAGCIAVTNREMSEIFGLIPAGTPVTIRP